MEQFVGFCLTFAVGSAGFFLLRWLRAPNPALLGSMIATGALDVFGYYPQFSTWLVSFVSNAVIGAMIATQIDRSILRRIRELARPVAVQTAGILALSVVCGYTLYVMGRSSSISLLTAMLSGTAGGVTEMLVFGLSTNADVSVIALVQVFRLVVSLTLIPYIALLGKKHGDALQTVPTKNIGLLPMFTRRDYGLLVLSMLAGAFAGRWLNIPSGALLGAMFGCGAHALYVNKVYVCDTRSRFLAQIGLGLVMGQRMTMVMVERLGEMLAPAVAVTVVMLVGCTLLAFLLRKTTGWDITTCLLCTAPAGLSQIAVFAEEIGVDSFTASMFHTARILSIVTLYPLCIMWF